MQAVGVAATAINGTSTRSPPDCWLLARPPVLRPDAVEACFLPLPPLLELPAPAIRINGRTGAMRLQHIQQQHQLSNRHDERLWVLHE